MIGIDPKGIPQENEVDKIEEAVKVVDKAKAHLSTLQVDEV